MRINSLFKKPFVCFSGFYVRREGAHNSDNIAPNQEKRQDEVKNARAGAEDVSAVSVKCYQVAAQMGNDRDSKSPTTVTHVPGGKSDDHGSQKKPKKSRRNLGLTVNADRSNEEYAEKYKDVQGSQTTSILYGSAQKITITDEYLKDLETQLGTAEKGYTRSKNEIARGASKVVYDAVSDQPGPPKVLVQLLKEDPSGVIERTLDTIKILKRINDSVDGGIPVLQYKVNTYGERRLELIANKCEPLSNHESSDAEVLRDLKGCINVLDELVEKASDLVFLDIKLDNFMKNLETGLIILVDTGLTYKVDSLPVTIVGTEADIPNDLAEELGKPNVKNRVSLLRTLGKTTLVTNYLRRSLLNEEDPKWFKTQDYIEFINNVLKEDIPEDKRTVLQYCKGILEESWEALNPDRELTEEK